MYWLKNVIGVDLVDNETREANHKLQSLKILPTTSHNIINIKPRFYIHIGIEYMLKPILKMYKHYFNINSNKIKLSFNIDGLPISKCSKSAFRPILMSITNIPTLII